MHNLKRKVVLTDMDGVLVDWLFSFDRWMCDNGYTIDKLGTYSMGERFGISEQSAKKLIRRFNSATFDNGDIDHIAADLTSALLPFRDARKAVKTMVDEYGINFHVITAFGNSMDNYARRRSNLIWAFGDYAKFMKLTCVNPYDKNGKINAIVANGYKDSRCVWVEDSPTHADEGAALGLQSFLMMHEHNESATVDPKVKRVHTWAQIIEHAHLMWR